MTNLTNIITTGMNNPECAFFTGHFIGQTTVLRYIIMVVGIQFIYKIMNTLALEPFIDWCKKKIYKKREYYGEDKILGVKRKEK